MNIHLKFGFRSLDDALDFYEQAPGNHIVRARYWGEGSDQEIFYVDKQEEWKGDPDTGMELYKLAQSYPSFITGSIESDLEEFSYMPGFQVVKRRR